MFAFLLWPAAWLAAGLAAVLFQADPAFPIPEWLVGALPVLNYVLNEVIIRIGGDLSADDKKNLVYAVSISIVAGLILFGGAPLPEGAPGDPGGTTLDVIVPYALAMGTYGILVLGWAWKGAQAIHDTLDALGRRTA